MENHLQGIEREVYLHVFDAHIRVFLNNLQANIIYSD